MPRTPEQEAVRMYENLGHLIARINEEARYCGLVALDERINEDDAMAWQDARTLLLKASVLVDEASGAIPPRT